MLAFPLTASAQFGSWTLYYSETPPQVNPDGSITITPTVSLTGSDGGIYCDPLVDCDGREQPLIMLSGNAWQAGEVYDAIGYPGYPIAFSYTFPSVTVSPGQTADLSYAGKVAGASRIIPGGGQWIYPTWSPFYQGAFLNGTGPLSFPGPCWIVGSYTNNGNPDCPQPWTSPWTGLPVAWHPSDLDSQQVAFTVRIAIATYALATVNENGTATYTLSCPNGNQNATCGTANLLGSQAHLWAEEYTIYSQPGGCFFANLVQYLDGPPAPKNCE